ncbi:error-prone DNA polymerase [Lysobacter helvus]|uniref:Error-prone DNA polymerase n=2 Tax=Lysobacteraceae TaxID=32033 RepID=A0ABM7Q5S2_9GAMM|nr:MULTISPECIES: error-prone DNA polymerase [Lysobacter]BCT92680.1 error-prone DNA polymerase [Lysobacter caseinilyticus]BCT95833.1 error-prone DNA polymerase [Lysobacter helvus]
MSRLPAYAELHCLSNFSFQRGASSAQELFDRAKQQGYAALAITDECSLAGIVRALEASEATELPLIVGSEMAIEDGPKLVLLVETQAGYRALCELITMARRRAGKGTYRLLREDFDRALDGVLALWVPRGAVSEAGADLSDAAWVRARFPDRAWVAVQLHRGPDDAARLRHLLALAQHAGMPAVACGDVHMHVRKRRALQDTMTAIRLRKTLAEAGRALFPNGERHLRTRQALQSIYPVELLAESVAIAARCTFGLRQIAYEYPRELVPEGRTPADWLRELVELGIHARWAKAQSGEKERSKARELIEKELRIIGRLGYESYFLTVHDIVRFARSRDILCQGRGSAANSAVCYALGITELQPGQMEMLFERFVSEERKEPPDIDVDFEHERREEVLQYVFERYGRSRAALAAVVIRYRGRSAVRDVARVLGLPPDQVDELAKTMERWSSDIPMPQHLREHGFDPESPLLRRVLALADELLGFPRHLSQHPGGFVISEHPLSTLVPVENAAMDDRTVIQWDKDDLDVLKLLKVDCLALGMLTCVHKTFDLLRASGRRDIGLDDIPPRDDATYAMIRKADTVGTFQIESRAQMAMLPRLKPRVFYDLVVQVAIVRPGPIQGDMVHPYLRRRNGEEPVRYPSEALREVFKRTLGVPLFQEQVMQLAIVAADYTPGEADQLRRSMAAWKRYGGMEHHRQKIIEGMLGNGYTSAFAEQIFEQIKGFGSYGFPESHAASFALIAYASSWLKCHEPAAFAAALINSQPMGFYAPSQIVQDVRRHGVVVRPVDVRYSEWDCTLEPIGDGKQPAVRLGLRMVDGFREADATRISAARARSAFIDVTDLCVRAELDPRVRGLLADAGALRALAGHRHKARWAAAGVEAQRPLFDAVGATAERQIALPMATAEEEVRIDYAMTGLTLGRHPLQLLRSRLRARRYRRSSELRAMPQGREVAFAGLVTLRQRPQTASGVTFLTLEDEDGLVNVVVWRQIADEQRRPLLESRLLAVEGKLESQDGVQHLIARRLTNLSGLLGPLVAGSRDFR